MSVEANVTLSGGRRLAPAQRALWLSQRLHPEAPVQNMALVTHIDGAVDPERLAAAFETVVDAADVLRTRIVDERGTPVVRLDGERRPTEIVPLDRSDVERWATARASIPIDIAVGAYDSVALPHADGTLSWYLCLHHTVTDATSSALVFAATAAAYHGETVAAGAYYRWAAELDRRLTPPTPDATANGSANGNGVAPEQNRDLRAIAHWADRQAAPAVDRLYQPVRTPTPTASRLAVPLTVELAAGIEAALQGRYRMLSPDLGWTTLLLTAAAAHLHQLAGVERCSLGLPVHNRSDATTRALIGPVMEVFPVDVEIEPGDTFAALHKRVSRAVMATLANARPGTAPAPDYAAVVNVIPRAPVGTFGPSATSTRWIHPGAIDAGHLLRIQLSAYDGDAVGDTTTDGEGDERIGPALAIDLNHAGADPVHRQRAPEHLAALLAAMVADPDRPVTTPIIGDDEQAAITAWETGPTAPASEGTVVGRLEAALADRTTIALRHDDRTWTGTELWAQITGTARWLRKQGLEAGDRVAIELPRSAEAVIGILAVLVAGGSFVPLDVAQPRQRLQSLTRRAGCRLALTTLPDADELAAAADVALNAPGTIGPEAEAYLLFTSGSTGQPKGVPITHGGLDGYLRFATDAYVEEGEAPVVPLFSALTFDLTITSLFLPLLCGGEQIVIEADGGAGLAAIAAEPRITWCKATPSHLEVLVRLLPPNHQLRTAVVGGEAFGAGLAKRMLRFRPEFAIYNEYGPTEAVVGCMIHRVDPERIDDHPEVPIGVPAPGVTLRVVGAGMQRVPLGAPGELLIAHDGVTVGYLTNDGDDETGGGDDGPFVWLPDADGASSDDATRFYRSGDLVRMVDDDTLVYLGRIDEQVKVGGIRLEPTEVTDALTTHPAVASAAVRLWSPTNNEPDHRCTRCGLPSNVPGTTFDDVGVCNVCHDYDRVAPQTESWFRTVDDLRAKQAEARERRTGRYDCLHLLSGGKDSTYALYQLVEAGFEPYALTLDNGFIAEGAKDNVRRSIADLGIDHEFVTPDAMNAIFRDSLERHSNVCHGCYKTIYVVATNRAVELGIPMIVTGLSRGQLFETRLIPQQFTPGRFDPDAIDRAVIEARKAYHRLDDGPNQLLDTEVFATDDVFEQIEYLDFFRYVDVELAEMLDFLGNRAPWVRPSDTGRSTNCLINAAGIHTHLTEQGYHNYAEPYAWDVRLGHKTRDEAIEELDDQLDPHEVRALLDAVGYVPAAPEILTAWWEPTPGATAPTPAELRAWLAERLPAHAIPAAFVTVDALPLTTNGKLDAAALPEPERVHRSSTGVTIAAETELEATIIRIWERLLRTEPIGATDDFFALGGDSLGALEMIVALGDAIDRPLSDDLGFGHTTPRALAAAIEAESDTDRGVAEPSAPPPTEARTWSSEEPPPLGPGEQSILYEQSLRPHDPMYNIGRVYIVGGRVEPTTFVDAVTAVAGRHAPFTWSYGRPRRPLSPTEAIEVTIGDAPLSAAEFEDRARIVHQAPFDLADGPLLRTWIQPLDDGTTAVLFVCHHVSSDAESFDRFWAQIDAELQGSPITPTIDYPTFIDWQQEQLTEADADHWRWSPDADRSEPTRLALEPPGVEEADGYLSRRASVDVADVANRAGATTFASSVAALAATLRRYSTGDAIPLAMITSMRSRAAEDLVGYFLNPLPLSIDCPLDAPLSEVVDGATAAVAGNLAHRAYPFARIVDDRRRAGVASPSPLIMAVFEELGTTSLLGLPVEQRILSPDAAVADATFWFQTSDGELHLGLEYRGSVLGRSQAEQLLNDLDAMLVALAERPATPIGRAALPSARASRLDGPPIDDLDSLLHLIDANAARIGDGEAVVCAGRRLTWGELADHADDTARRLLDAGVEPGDRVTVAVPRSIELMVAIMGVLRAGAAYVPVDPTYPPDRIALIMGAARSAATLTAPDFRVPVDVDGGAVLTVDLDRPSNPLIGDRRPLPAVNGDTTAYVIFTSGSTGTPKGVPVSHRQLAASTRARAGVYDRPADRFLMVSSPAFDSSVAGLFWALADGGTIVLPTDGEAQDPDALVALFAAERVTHTLMVPTLYRALLSRNRGGPWPSQVIVAGEACSPALVAAHTASRDRSALTNEYGPTEATVWATAHHCAPGDDPVPIGVPIPGTWVAVVDEADEPRPDGVIGNLVIGGAGVVDGYLDDPEATAAKFGDGPDGRFFRTGDRAVIRDGVVHFLGRSDNQLNVGGVRAEPEDIERVFEADPSVAAAVVCAIDPRPVESLMAAVEPDQLREYLLLTSAGDDPAAALLRVLRTAPEARPELVVFIEPVTGAAVDVTALRERAGVELPPLLRPTTVAVVDALPLSPNGKVDRDAAVSLPLPVAVQGQATTVAAGGSAEGIEGRIAALFAMTLRLPEPPPGDASFFDLGGHSLAAMELLGELERSFEVDLTVSTLHEHPSPGALAALVAARPEAMVQNRYLVPIQPPSRSTGAGTGGATKPPLFGIHVLGVNAEFYRPLAAELGPDQPVWGLGLPTATPDTSNPTEVAEVAGRYVTELERVAPTGPVSLAAVSLGSVVAFEVARQLRARGRTVALLAMFDAVGPDLADTATSAGARLRVHAQELGRSPLRYTADRSRRANDRLGRRLDIAQIAVRRALRLPLGNRLQIREFVEANWASQGSYAFEPYDGPLVVYKAGDDAFTRHLADTGMGWTGVAEGPFRVTVVDGGHLSMLAEPNVAGLAAAMAADMAEMIDAVAYGSPPPRTGRGPADVERTVVEALGTGRLTRVLPRLVDEAAAMSADDAALIGRIDRATRACADDAGDRAAEAHTALTNAGVTVMVDPVPRRLTFPVARLAVTGDGPDGVPPVATVVETLAAIGYRLQQRIGIDELEALAAGGRLPPCPFLATDGLARLDVRWSADADTGLTDRSGVDADTDLGIFLGTPPDLIQPVLALAEPADDELVVDLGCGDGRVLIEAVERFGGRGRGVESDPALVAAARVLVEKAGLADRIEIIEADAASADVSDADVVFLFLPPSAVRRLLIELPNRMRTGARIVAHEQLAIDWPIGPDRSTLIAEHHLTVAHRWDIR